MNIDSDPAVEEALRQGLLACLSAVEWLSVTWRCRRWHPSEPNDGKWDFMVRVESREREFGLAVLTRARLEPRQFQELARQRENSPRAKVLGLPHVTARMAELCQQMGWSWYDLAGNCRLEVPGLLLIERSGARPSRLHRVREANLSSPEAARVIRALLVSENAGRHWTQREVVHHFAQLPQTIPAPSLALVNKIIRYLADQAVVKATKRGFEVSDPDGLLQLWAPAYAWERQVRHRYFTLLPAAALAPRLADLSDWDDPVAYGVFSAAERQAPHVRQPRIWLYAPGSREEELVALLEAKPVDSGENLVLLIPDDPGVFYRLDRGLPGLPCTNPVQTYVDLRQAGGRGEEAAEALRTQRLRPEWAGEKP